MKNSPSFELEVGVWKGWNFPSEKPQGLTMNPSIFVVIILILVTFAATLILTFLGVKIGDLDSKWPIEVILLANYVVVLFFIHAVTHRYWNQNYRKQNQNWRKELPLLSFFTGFLFLFFGVILFLLGGYPSKVLTVGLYGFAASGAFLIALTPILIVILRSWRSR